MKKITKSVHDFIRYLQLDDLISEYLQFIPYFWKLIPTNKEYPKIVVKRVKRGGLHFELQLSDYMQWHIYANMPELLWEKTWDRISNNTTILDVGANVGAFTLKTASFLKNKGISHNLYAFEPNPLIYPKLDRNLSLNPHLNSSISLEQLALSSTSGDMYFDFNEDNSGGGKLASYDTGIKVKVETLDSFVLRRDIKKVSLIKIDVEGFEPAVLKGARNTIEVYRPMLILEMTDQWFREIDSSTTEIIQYLIDLDYFIIADVDGRIQPKMSIEDIPQSFQFNILAIPNI